MYFTGWIFFFFKTQNSLYTVSQFHQDFNDQQLFHWLFKTPWHEVVFSMSAHSSLISGNASETLVWAPPVRGCSAASAACHWNPWPLHEPGQTASPQAPSSLGLSKQAASGGLQSCLHQLQEAEKQTVKDQMLTGPSENQCDRSSDKSGRCTTSSTSWSGTSCAKISHLKQVEKEKFH